jgi:hypothetical protein
MTNDYFFRGRKCRKNVEWLYAEVMMNLSAIVTTKALFRYHTI